MKVDFNYLRQTNPHFAGVYKQKCHFDFPNYYSTNKTKSAEEMSKLMSEFLA